MSVVLMQGTNSEENLCNVTQTVPINILMKPGIVEHVQIGQNCSTAKIEIYMALFKEFRDVFSWIYEGMPGIDPLIVFHEINTYPSKKIIR